MTAHLAARLALPDLAGLTDEEAADALNRPDAIHGTKRRDAPVGEVEGWARSRGIVTRLELFLRRPLPPEGDPSFLLTAQLYAAANEFVGMLRSPQVRVFEMRAPDKRAAIVAMTGGMEAAGLLSAAERAELLALGEEPRSEAEAAGWPTPITARDVGLARGAI